MKIIIIISILIIYLINLIDSSSIPAPILYDKYSWSIGQNGIRSIILTGKSFDYTSSNIAIINGTEFDCGVAIASSIQGYDQITCSPDATLSIADAEPFSALVKSFGQNSNVRNWYKIRPIYTQLQFARFVNYGTNAAIICDFTTLDISIVNLTIGGEQAEVQNLEYLGPSVYRLYFFAPYKQEPGIYDFLVVVGGLQFKTNITYAYGSPPSIGVKYSWTTLQNGLKVMTFYGGPFSKYHSNIMVINGVNYTTTFASSNGFNVSLLDDTASNLLNEGDTFTVRAIVAGQKTDRDTYFNFLRSISLNKPDVLQSIGGVVTFEGSFGVGTAYPTIAIGQYNCYMDLEFSTTYIKCRYPIYPAGNYSLVINLQGLQIDDTVTYVTSPRPTLLYKYNWLNFNSPLTLTGRWFGYYSTNYVSINNGTFNPSPYAEPAPFGYDSITTTFSDLSLSIGDNFSIVVQVEGQSSDIINFIYLESIPMVISQDLNTTGGITTMSGSFTVSKTDVVTISIENIPCNVISVTPSLIKFRYPPMTTDGQYTLLINIGGFENSTIVQYVEPQSPSIILNYKWSLSGDKLIIIGTWFSYVNQNYLIINGVNYTATLAVGSDIEGYDEITFEDQSWLSETSLHEDQLFTVQVSTGGLQSSIVSFYFIKPISMLTNDIYNIGGIGSEFVKFTGVYGTSNTSFVSMIIGGSEINVESIEPSSITFSYDSIEEIKLNQLQLTIGGLQFITMVNVISTPKPTLLNNYYWSSNDILILRGKTFNYVSPNIVNVNGNNYTSTIKPTLNNIGNEEITFNDNSSTLSLEIGSPFTVFINNGIENSNSITFINIKSISVNTSNLNDTGGQVTFSGEYHVTDITFVSLLIDGTISQVTDVTKTSITFKYPIKSVGQYNLLINIGGFEYSTTVQYITTPSTPSTSSSSDEDTPSISNKLSISFFLSSFLFLLFLF